MNGIDISAFQSTFIAALEGVGLNHQGHMRNVAEAFLIAVFFLEG
jgi:hypothetical protein